MDADKPRPMTDDEIKAHEAALTMEAAEKAAAADLEAKIQTELRTMAIERLKMKNSL